jgi:hypothetical protein
VLRLSKQAGTRGSREEGRKGSGLGKVEGLASRARPRQPSSRHAADVPRSAPRLRRKVSGSTQAQPTAAMAARRVVHQASPNA